MFLIILLDNVPCGSVYHLVCDNHCFTHVTYTLISNITAYVLIVIMLEPQADTDRHVKWRALWD